MRTDRLRPVWQRPASKRAKDRRRPLESTAEPTVTPDPTPTPFGADAFQDPDSCANEVDGYRVAFPNAWYYNTAFGDTAACRFFHPEAYEVADGEAPPTAISFQPTEGLAIGTIAIYSVVEQEETTVDGRPAVRWEMRGSEPGALGPDDYLYSYQVEVSDDPNGPSIRATVDSRNHPDYEANEAILDRMMETFEVIGSDAPS